MLSSFVFCAVRPGTPMQGSEVGHGRHGLQPDPTHDATSNDPAGGGYPADCADTVSVLEVLLAPAGHTVNVWVVVPLALQVNGNWSCPFAG